MSAHAAATAITGIRGDLVVRLPQFDPYASLTSRRLDAFTAPKKSASAALVLAGVGYVG